MVKQLDENDREVLAHIARYHLTMADILAHTGLCDEGVKAAGETLERLHKDGWLVRGELLPNGTAGACYQLTFRAAEQLGYDADFARPLQLDARIECYAVAQFCCCQGIFRELFTKHEFREKFADIWFPGQPVRYYLETDEASPARLAFLKVDRDGHGRWDRIIDSCARFLRQRTDRAKVATEHRPRVEAFGRLVAEGKFQISVLTALAEKKRAIGVELERRMGMDEDVPPIQVYVVPGLFEVMFPAPID
jgi:hypothetical protein